MLKKCIICQKEFIPYKFNHNICSNKCRKEYRKEYMKQYYRNNIVKYGRNNIVKYKKVKKDTATKSYLKRHGNLDNYKYHEGARCGTDGIMYGIKGENHPAWKGGLSFEPYCYKFNSKLKNKIRERDNNMCQNCGKTQEVNNRKLSVHHVHYDKENCYPDLISLCGSCNVKANFNRDYWEEYYMKILNKRGLLNY